MGILGHRRNTRIPAQKQETKGDQVLVILQLCSSCQPIQALVSAFLDSQSREEYREDPKYTFGKILFRKRTSEEYVASGDEHLRRAGDLERNLERRELQKTISDYSKALDVYLEEEAKDTSYPHAVRPRGPPAIRLDNYSLCCISFDASHRQLDGNAILTRRSLAYFLDGQYDRAVEDSSRKEHLFEGVPIFESRGQELMRARAFAARGSYEEALRLYSDLEKRPSTWSTLAVSDEQPFEGLGFTVTIEPAALQCKLGRLREAAELLTKHFAMGPSIDFRRRIYHVKDFEEEALKKSQEVLFPHGPTDPLSLIFYVALKGPDAPPITRMRESVKLSRVVHDVGEQLGVETNKYGRPFKMIEGYRRLPSLIGGFVFLVARSQRAAEFTRQIRVRADIEQIECFDHIYP